MIHLMMNSNNSVALEFMKRVIIRRKVYFKGIFNISTFLTTLNMNKTEQTNPRIWQSKWPLKSKWKVYSHTSEAIKPLLPSTLLQQTLTLCPKLSNILLKPRFRTHTQFRPEMNKICTWGGHARDRGPGQIAQLHICIEGCIRDTPTCNLIFAMSVPPATPSVLKSSSLPVPFSPIRLRTLEWDYSLQIFRHCREDRILRTSVSFCLRRWLSIWGAQITLIVYKFDLWGVWYWNIFVLKMGCALWQGWWLSPFGIFVF